jgi:hypothetical protein
VHLALADPVGGQLEVQALSELAAPGLEVERVVDRDGI